MRSAVTVVVIAIAALLLLMGPNLVADLATLWGSAKLVPGHMLDRLSPSLSEYGVIVLLVIVAVWLVIKFVRRVPEIETH